MADALEQAALEGRLTSPPSNEPDPDGREPIRWDELSDGGASSDGTDGPSSSARASSRPAADRLHNTASQGMTRGWSGNTGPKGVLQDFKASHGKSGAILGGAEMEQKMQRVSLNKAGNHHHAQTNSKSTGSGSESEGEREAKEAYRRQRIAEIAAAKGGRSSPGVVNVDARGRKMFGHLREVGVQNFVQLIDAEKDDKQTAVVIHLYDPDHDPCNVLNAHLSTLARRHPHTKFLKGLASELDYFNDSTPAPSPAATSTSLTNRIGSGGISIPTLTPSPSRGSFSTVSTHGDPFRDREGSVASTASDLFVDSSGRRRRATDSDVLPTLLWYRGGEFVKSLHAIERDLPDHQIKRGEEGCRQIQKLLASHGLISMSDTDTNPTGQLYRPHKRSVGGDEEDSDFD